MNQTTKQTSADVDLTSFAPSQEQKAASDNPSPIEAEILDKEPVDPNPFAYVAPEHSGQHKSDFFNPEDEWKATVIGEDPKGRVIQIKKREQSHGYEVQVRTGGSKPKELKGWFTSYDTAERTARTYLNRQWDLEKSA